jgi:CDGSH-type Zn-finger protein
MSSAAQQFIVPDEEGTSRHYQEGERFDLSDPVSLCRCGQSKNKPFCDGSHRHAAEHGVDLAETATFDPELETAQVFRGPRRFLTDDQKLCAFARFCDAGQQVWNEIAMEGEAAEQETLEMAHHCPGGRLIVWDNEKKTPIETYEDPSVSLVEDIYERCSGPIMLRGGIPVVSGSGRGYEVRNRQALCRCGHSSNKPFCDGTHASVRFEDGLPTRPPADGATS